MKKATLLSVLILLYGCKENQSAKMTTKPYALPLKDEVKKDSLFASKCNFSTYVIYKDALPIYESPDGKIIQYFRFEDEFILTLEGFWVKSEYIEVGTTNYANDTISIT